MYDKILLPSQTGIAHSQYGTLIFNRTIVQRLIDWMADKPKTYKQCVEFIQNIFVEEKLIIVDDDRVLTCIEKLDEYWRMDETKH